MRTVLALMLAVRAAGALALTDAAEPWPPSLTGTAEVALATDRNHVNTRLVFAAGVDPTALRIELIRAGTLLAVLWCDDERVKILLPGEPSLLHEGPASRETLETALGLPFCPQELLFALRAGLAPAPRCAGLEDSPVLRDGRVVGLKRAAAPPGAPLALEFLRFERTGSRSWPKRALLRSAEGAATVDVLALQERPVSPSPPVGPAWDSATQVSAAAIARALGIDEPRAP